MSYFNSAEQGYFKQMEPMSTLKHLSGRKHFFQNLTQLLQGRIVLDAPASNTDCVLWRGT
jgi:hypothetical protein